MDWWKNTQGISHLEYCQRENNKEVLKYFSVRECVNDSGEDGQFMLCKG